MKIAIIVLYFPPNWLGGTEIATYNIARYLVMKGHEVHIITLLDKQMQKIEMMEGFYVHHIIRHSRTPLISSALYFTSIFVNIKRICPDIIHCQSLSAGWIPFLLKIFLKTPYVIYGRGSDIYTNYRFKNIILRLAIKNANSVIALTEDMKKEMNKIDRQDVFVIPNGITIDDYCENSPNIIRRRDNEKIILFVGGLRSVKGVNYLICAMKDVIEKYPNARLILVGDGEERRNLENLADKLNLNQKITFVGNIPNKDVSKYMKEADIFVLPSLSEGFPVVILEAMASGLPIVTTKIRGIPEIVKEGINGFLVEPRSSKKIAEKVVFLLRNENVATSISENNKVDVKQYSWENVVKRLENIYLMSI